MTARRLSTLSLRFCERRAEQTRRSRLEVERGSEISVYRNYNLGCKSRE